MGGCPVHHPSVNLYRERPKDRSSDAWLKNAAGETTRTPAGSAPIVSGAFGDLLLPVPFQDAGLSWMGKQILQILCFAIRVIRPPGNTAFRFLLLGDGHG
jgi:hypothetical protein